MNREETIAIIRKEYLCVDRDCDIDRSCGKCDLMMPSKEPILEAYKMAIKALEQEPCEDAIDRAEAIKIASGYCHPANVAKELAKLPPVNPQEPTDTWSIKDVADTLEKHGLIGEQEPKTGHWIEHPEIETSTPEYLMFYECSECGDKQCFCKSDIHKKRFCGNCGCRMVKPQERSDKE